MMMMNFEEPQRGRNNRDITEKKVELASEWFPIFYQLL